MACNDETTSAEQAKLIADLLNSGITQTVMDGQSTSFNLEFLERRRRELLMDDPLALLACRTRPVMFTARMPYIS